MGDQVPRFKHRLALRRVAGKEVKIRKRNCTLALAPPDMNDGLESGHRDAHVRRICRNAMFAGAKNRQASICSVDGGATATRFALIARHVGRAKIHAARPLQQIAGGRCHVPQLDRGAAQDRFRKDTVVLTDNRVVSQVGVANTGANR